VIAMSETILVEKRQIDIAREWHAAVEKRVENLDDNDHVSLCYVGHAVDLKQRMNQHRSEKGGCELLALFMQFVNHYRSGLPDEEFVVEAYPVFFLTELGA
jgi:hypothetical protein